MIVRAPGKLLLFGAYAVLEAGQAVVVAVDRHAVADDSRAADPASREVRAALGDERAPHVDVSALYDDGAKLGLGSSAAALVATLGARAATRGEDLRAPAIRDAIFAHARTAHAAAQSGGSGVDVAASTYGGAVAYTMANGARPFALPSALHFVAFWSGESARTSDLLARVVSLKARDPRAHSAALSALAEAARHAIDHAGDVAELVAAGQATARALAALGDAADAPIVPAAFAELGALAATGRAAFYPSGAGGGDVGVWVADHAPPGPFLDRARALGMRPLSLRIDSVGVCIGRKD